MSLTEKEARALVRATEALDEAYKTLNKIRAEYAGDEELLTKLSSVGTLLEGAYTDLDYIA